jgi:iron complex outermembrane recepter protein
VHLRGNLVSSAAMCGCSIIALAGAGRDHAAEAAAAAAPSQAAAPVDGTHLEEVVVTAQRVEQELQKVPVAETAFSNAQLLEHGIANVEDVQFHVPNINIRDETNNGSLSIGIRGISVSAENFSYDSAVGVYLNSVFIARGSDFNGTFFDVDNVQVLRGPQGTLFGRDTPVGAVLVDTTRPGSSYGGYVDASLGFGGDGLGKGSGRNIYRFEGAVNLPIAPDLALRIAGYHVTDTGYADSSVTGDRNSKNDSGVRATAAFTPSDKFKATLIIDYNGKNDGPAVFVPLGFTGFVSPTPVDELNGGMAAHNAVVGLINHFNPYQGESNAPGQGLTARSYSATLLMDYRFSENWDLRSITGYRHTTNNTLVDTVSIPFPFGIPRRVILVHGEGLGFLRVTLGAWNSVRSLASICAYLAAPVNKLLIGRQVKCERVEGVSLACCAVGRAIAAKVWGLGRCGDGVAAATAPSECVRRYIAIFLCRFDASGVGRSPSAPFTQQDRLWFENRRP